MTRIYHIGLGKQAETLVVQARRCIDYLDCETYDYLGRRETTKAALHEHRFDVLKWARSWKPDVYGGLTKVVVD